MDLKHLAALLDEESTVFKTADDDDNPDNVCAQHHASSYSSATPGTISGIGSNSSLSKTTMTKVVAVGGSPATSSERKPSDSGKDIWAADEVTTVSAPFDDEPHKEIPEYEVVRSQKVSATDVYLGFSDKDPSALHCESLVVRIKLPGVSSVSEITLDVTDTTLCASTRTHKLVLPLPVRVMENDGRAAWDRGQSQLQVTLPVVQPEDEDVGDE